MKASSSRITSSVFQIITRSSKLDNSRALTRGERDDDRQTDRRTDGEEKHAHTQTDEKRTQEKKMETKQNKKKVNCKKKIKFHATPTGRGSVAASRCTYPLTNMSLDFSPVK